MFKCRSREGLKVIQVPQEREDVLQSPEAVELVKLVSQERVQPRSAEKIDYVPQSPQETVEVVSLALQERVQQRTAEVLVEFVRLVSQERVQQRIAEARELSDTWTGFTRFTILKEKPPDGHTWSG